MDVWRFDNECGLAAAWLLFRAVYDHIIVRSSQQSRRPSTSALSSSHSQSMCEAAAPPGPDDHWIVLSMSDGSHQNSTSNRCAWMTQALALPPEPCATELSQRHGTGIAGIIPGNQTVGLSRASGLPVPCLTGTGDSPAHTFEDAESSKL